MKEFMRQADDQFPSEQKHAMNAGHSIRVRELPEPVRELLRKAITLCWGHRLLEVADQPPFWVTDLISRSIEFGLYRQDAEGLAAGMEYVRIHEGAEERLRKFQVAISARFDKP